MRASTSSASYGPMFTLLPRGDDVHASRRGHAAQTWAGNWNRARPGRITKRVVVTPAGQITVPRCRWMVNALLGKPPELFRTGGALATTTAPASISAVRLAPDPYAESPTTVISASSASSSGSRAGATLPSETLAGTTSISVMSSDSGSTATWAL